MEEFLIQIKQALKHNLFYIALQSTLTIPDICSSLISENGQTNKKLYIDWYNTYAKEKRPKAIDGEICYYFRCSAIHQNTTLNERSPYNRIIFLEPGKSNALIHNSIINGALNIDLVIFCMNIINAAEKWYQNTKDNSTFKKNYENFFKRYPDGLSPYIKGVPILT